MLLLLMTHFTRPESIQSLLHVLETALECPEEPLIPSGDAANLAGELVLAGLLKESIPGHYVPDLDRIETLLPMMDSTEREQNENRASFEPRKHFGDWLNTIRKHAPEAAVELKRMLEKACRHRPLQTIRAFIEITQSFLRRETKEWPAARLDAEQTNMLARWGLLNDNTAALDFERIRGLLPLLNASLFTEAEGVNTTLQLLGGFRAAFLEIFLALQKEAPSLAEALKQTLEACAELQQAHSVSETKLPKFLARPEAYGSKLKTYLKAQQEQLTWLREGFGPPLYSEDGSGPKRLTMRLNYDLFDLKEVAQYLQDSQQGQMLLARKRVYTAIEAKREPEEADILTAKLRREVLPALKAHRKDGLRVVPALLILHLGLKKVRCAIFASPYTFGKSDCAESLSNQIAVDAVATILREPAAAADITCAHGKTLSLSVDVSLLGRPLESSFSSVIGAIARLSQLLRMDGADEAVAVHAKDITPPSNPRPGWLPAPHTQSRPKGLRLLLPG
jgi:hypothetical protein